MWGQPPPAVFLRVPSCPLWLSCLHALPAPLLVECDERPSSRPLAQPLSAMAHRNLYRRQDDANRLPGILGVRMARAPRAVEVPQLDRRDGTLRPPQAKEFVSDVINHRGHRGHTENHSMIFSVSSVSSVVNRGVKRPCRQPRLRPEEC